MGHRPTSMLGAMQHEQAMVVDESLSEAALEECRKQGAYFLSASEMEKLGALLFQRILILFDGRV